MDLDPTGILFAFGFALAIAGAIYAAHGHYTLAGYCIAGGAFAFGFSKSLADANRGGL